MAALLKSDKRKKRSENWHSYIHKVLKQVYPDMTVTMLSMKILNSFVEDIFNRIASEAAQLIQINVGNTLDARCVETATKLTLIGALKKHGVIEARKAVNKYNAALNNKKDDTKTVKNERRHKKAGLQFPVGRIARYLKERDYAKRVSGLASVYLAAVLEYMMAEIIEISGKACKEMKKHRISPIHIHIAIKKDNEMKVLFNEIILPQTGYVHQLYVNENK